MKAISRVSQLASAIFILLIASGGACLANGQSAKGFSETLPDPLAIDPAVEKLSQEVIRGSQTTRDKLNALVEHIFSERGIGLRYRRVPTITAQQAFDQRAGNCLSFVNLFVAMARSVKIRAYFVEVKDYEVYHRLGRNVFNSTHIIGGVNLGSEIFTIDFLPYRPKRYRKYHRITDQRAIAHFFNNLGTERMTEDDYITAENYYRESLSYERRFAFAWNNYGVLLKRQGKIRESMKMFEKALSIDNSYLAALENLSVLYNQLKMTDRAVKVEKKIGQAKSRNPFYLLHRAYFAIESGEYPAAREYLKQARKLDDDIPEIYLNLARIALAEGDEQEAQQYFKIAELKSTTYSEGFRDAMRTKIESIVDNLP